MTLFRHQLPTFAVNPGAGFISGIRLNAGLIAPEGLGFQVERLQAAGLYTLKEGRLKRVNPAAMARLADYSTLPLRIRPLI